MGEERTKKGYYKCVRLVYGALSVSEGEKRSAVSRLLKNGSAVQWRNVNNLYVLQCVEFPGRERQGLPSPAVTGSPLQGEQKEGLISMPQIWVMDSIWRTTYHILDSQRRTR